MKKMAWGADDLLLVVRETVQDMVEQDGGGAAGGAPPTSMPPTRLRVPKLPLRGGSPRWLSEVASSEVAQSPRWTQFCLAET